MSVLSVCARCTLRIETMLRNALKVTREVSLFIQWVDVTSTHSTNRLTSLVTPNTFRSIVSICKVHLTHTDGTDIRPQSAPFYNECKSTDPSLVTWQSAVYEPPEDGFMRDRNMQGQMLNVLIWDFNVFKVYKLYIGWNSKIVIESRCTVQQWKLKSICSVLCIQLFGLYLSYRMAVNCAKG